MTEIVKKKPPATASKAAPAKAVQPENILRKKDLIDRVVLRSGVKKRDAKPAIEAALAVLGDALEAGEMLNLQPFGRLVVKREIDKPNAKILVCRLRRRKDFGVKAAPKS